MSNKYNFLYISVLIQMFDLEEYETPHTNYALMQPFVFLQSSSLQPWNKTTTGYHPHKRQKNQLTPNKQLKMAKTHQNFYSRLNNQSKNEGVYDRKKKSEIEKQKFPVSTLTFYPDAIGLESARKKIKEKANTTSFRFKKTVKSCDKIRQNQQDVSLLSESESKQLQRGLKPTFDYTALLRRRQENKIKYKAMSAKRELSAYKTHIHSIKDLSEQKMKGQREKVYTPKKSLSFMEISKDFESAPSIQSLKVPRKPFFVGIRKIMTQKF